MTKAMEVYVIALPSVYSNPFRKTRLRFSISLLIKPIAVIFVASGQGLMAVINPSTNADTHGVELLSRSEVRKSIIVNVLIC
jgi:hypothetical protein